MADRREELSEDDGRLRDEFAASALHAILSNPARLLDYSPAERAADAYRHADAMMEARKR